MTESKTRTVINRARQTLLLPGFGPLHPGDTPVEVPGSVVVDELLEVGALEEPHGKPVPGHESSPFADLNLAELKAYADAHGIDLGDATKKADVLDRVEQAAAENPNEEDR